MLEGAQAPYPTPFQPCSGQPSASRCYGVQPSRAAWIGCYWSLLCTDAHRSPSAWDVFLPRPPDHPSTPHRRVSPQPHPRQLHLLYCLPHLCLIKPLPHPVLILYLTTTFTGWTILGPTSELSRSQESCTEGQASETRERFVTQPSLTMRKANLESSSSSVLEEESGNRMGK